MADKWGKSKHDVMANNRLNWIAEKRKLHENEFDIIGSPDKVGPRPKRTYDEMEYDDYLDDLDSIMVKVLFYFILYSKFISHLFAPFMYYVSTFLPTATFSRIFLLLYVLKISNYSVKNSSKCNVEKEILLF